MRNPRRSPGPIRRTIVTIPMPEPVSRNLLLRTHTDIAPSMPVRRTRSAGLAGAQTNGWQETPYLKPCTTAMTAAWDRTRST